MSELAAPDAPSHDESSLTQEDPTSSYSGGEGTSTADPTTPADTGSPMSLDESISEQEQALAQEDPELVSALQAESQAIDELSSTDPQTAGALTEIEEEQIEQADPQLLEDVLAESEQGQATEPTTAPSSTTGPEPSASGTGT